MVETLGVFGHYQLESTLGAGGMGHVFAARDVVLGRRVAVKVIASALAASSEAKQRFEHECRLAAAIDHPHVIPVYEAGECEGRLFLAMRFVDGVDLHTLACGMGGLAVERAVAIVSQLASGLDAIHEHGLVHRDVKPQNVLIADINRTEHVYVCDFGIAAALTGPPRGLTGSGEFIGTVGYVAPEQLRGEAVDARADVYGLGCVLFEALAGRGPFSGLADGAKVAAQLTSAPPTLEELGVDVPVGLDRVVARAMDGDRERRFASAGELAAAARAAVDAASARSRWGVGAGIETDAARPAGVDASTETASHEHIDLKPDAYRPPPIPPTPTIGREQEVDAISGLLTDSDARLVTLTGPGGVGKTRVALTVARAIGGSFADGVCWVELASVTRSEDVESTLAHALAIALLPGEHTLDALRRVLEGRRLLLAMDNFEHVLEASGLIAALHRDCPGVRLLVTSREALNLAGEHRVRIAPLPVPAEAASVAEIEATAGSAVFLAAARRHDSNFSISDSAASAVARICARLDGLPLALELAAGWSAVFGPGALENRLAERLALPEGPRDLPERQRTLAATIDWSYQLLEPAERTLFEALAPFVGGVRVDSAESLWGREACDRLISLSEKNLLRCLVDPDEEPRFSMLETVREFAVERAAGADSAAALADRHADYFFALVQQAAPHLVDGDQVRWLDRLECDHANIRAALDHLTANAPSQAVHMAANLEWFWVVRGYLTEARSRLAAAIAAAPAGGARAQALAAAGQMAVHLGETSEAKRLLLEALSLAKPEGNARVSVLALSHLGTVEGALGDQAHSASHHEEAVAAARAAGDDWALTISLNNYAVTLSWSEQLERARPLFEESLRLSRHLGDPRGIALAAGNVAALALDAGDLETAEACIDEALRQARAVNYRNIIALALHLRAALSLERGDLEAATAQVKEALELARSSYDAQAALGLLSMAGDLAAIRQRPLRAAKLWASADQVRARIGEVGNDDLRAKWQPEARAAAPDAATWDAAWAAGAKLSLEEAFALAASDDEL